MRARGIGDFIDGLLPRFSVAIERHQELLHELWALKRRGVRITYVPGNHDAFARRYAGLRIGDVAIAREAVHETADGRRLWLVHGDEFDSASKSLTALSDVAVGAVHAADAIRTALGLPYAPYASRVRRKVRTSVPYLLAYERRAAEEARRRPDVARLAAPSGAPGRRGRRLPRPNRAGTYRRRGDDA